MATRPQIGRWKTAGERGGFTLLELLVVIAIMGFLAATSVPAIRALTQTNKEASGERQVLDELTLARQLALNHRRTVYLLLLPAFPAEAQRDAVLSSPRIRDPRERRRVAGLITNLFQQQFRAYALFSRRSVGDQPGQGTPRYLSEWRTLPEGLLFTTNKFVYLDKGQWEAVSASVPLERRPLPWALFPFPTAESPLMVLPYVAFDSLGRIHYDDDRRPARPGEVVSISRGSVFYPLDARGLVNLRSAPDITINPKDNRVDIMINWLTGRARVLKPEMP
ncbi:MAG: type II secretion system protein [Verrucomicrobia bacterium]|nr:MAG: type II secretion system protein [Verrucomicrobiota bacterium]